MAIFNQGPLAQRPSAQSNPQTFWANTDVEPNELSYSNGQVWIQLSAGPFEESVTAIGTIPGLQPMLDDLEADLAAKADVAAVQAVQDALTAKADAAAIQTQLSGKADTSHTHTELPTPGQKNALSGTQGTPGATNQYVTTQDPRNSDSRTPTAHTHVWADITNPPAQGGGASHVKLTADLPASTLVAMGNTTGLSFAVTSGTLYRFTAFVVFRSAATTTGIRLGATTPAFTVYTAAVSTPLAADGAGGMWHGFLTTSGDSVVATGVQAANTDYLAVIQGVLLPSANGTFQLQHATEIAASAVTVRNGSHISYQAI